MENGLHLISVWREEVLRGEKFSSDGDVFAFSLAFDVLAIFELFGGNKYCGDNSNGGSGLLAIWWSLVFCCMMFVALFKLFGGNKYCGDNFALGGGFKTVGKY